MVFITETECVYCAVRIVFKYYRVNFLFQSVNGRKILFYECR